MNTQEWAVFLGKWSNGKRIQKVCEGSRMYRCGKWMTQLESETVELLLASGVATGIVNDFTVPKVKKSKLDRESELD